MKSKHQTLEKRSELKQLRAESFETTSTFDFEAYHNIIIHKPGILSAITNMKYFSKSISF